MNRYRAWRFRRAVRRYPERAEMFMAAVGELCRANERGAVACAALADTIRSLPAA